MKRVIFLVVGLALLGFGGYRQFVANGVPEAERARCEQILRDKSGDDAEALAALLPSCSDPGMVAMMDAQAGNETAADAARRISAANQADTGNHLLDWFAIGLGAVLTLAGAFNLNNRRRV